MQDIELRLNGKRVELADSAAVALTYEVHDLNNLESRNGGKSNEFEAPIEPNQAALETLHDSQSASLLPYRLTPATLEARGVPIPCGLAEITESGDTVKIILRPGNSDLWSKIRGKNLRDLDLKGLVYSYFGQLALTTATDTICFLIGETGRTIDRPRNDVDMLADELVFHAYSKYVLEQIIAQAGFIPAGTLFDLPQFALEVLPQTDYIKFRQSYLDAQYAEASVLVAYPTPASSGTHPVLFPNVVADASGAFNAVTSEYITPVTRGDYKVTVDLFIDTPAFYSPATLKIHLNGSAVLSQAVFSPVSPAELRYRVQATIKDVSAATIKIVIEYVYVDTFNINPGSKLVIEQLNHAYSDPDTPLHVDANLPDLSQLDFLKDVVNRYNVVIDTQDDTVEFDLFTDVASRSPENWTEKVDMSITPVTSYRLDGYAQINWFAYEEDEQETYSASIDISNTALEQERTLYTSPFTFTEDLPSFDNSALLPRIPLVTYDKPLKLWIYGTLILQDEYIYDEGRYYKCLFANYTPVFGDVITDSAITNGSGTAAERIPDPGNYSATGMRVHYRRERTSAINVASGTGNAPGFPVLEEGAFEGMEWPTLLSTYYPPLTALLQTMQQVTCYMRLSAPDVAQLPFTRPVYINPVVIKGRTYFGARYYLNLVEEYLPGTDASTQVVLIRLD